MSHVVVWGASGFIGKALVNQLISEGYFVYGLSRKMFSVPSEWANNYKHCCVDFLASKADLQELVREAYCVIHCAGHYDAEDEMLEQYVTSVRNLSEVCVESGAKNFILLSSLAVYGAGLEGVFGVNSILNPHTKYGVSRVRAECAAKDVFERSNQTMTCVRIPAVVGVGMKSIVLSGFFRMLVTRCLFHPGRYGASLAFVGIKSLSKLLTNLVKAPSVAGTNLIQPVKNMTWVDLATEYSKVSGRRIIHIPLPGRLLMRALNAVGCRSPGPLKALLSEAIFINKTDAFLDTDSIAESVDDVREIIRFLIGKT